MSVSIRIFLSELLQFWIDYVCYWQCYSISFFLSQLIVWHTLGRTFQGPSFQHQLHRLLDVLLVQNFQKTIDISQPFTNQSGTFSFEFVTPYHMYERSPAVYQDKISTVEPKTTNGLSETMEAKGNDDINMLV